MPLLATGADTKPKQPVATVDGQPIYDEDLAPSIEGQLQPLRNQEFEIKPLSQGAGVRAPPMPPARLRR